MIKFYHDNLLWADSTTITASDEDGFFPASNLADTRRTKVFRSTAISSSIVIDTISTEEVDSILLVPNSKTGWGFTSPILVSANPTNTWGSPAYSTSIISSEIDQEHDFAFKSITQQSYRFWRFTFDGTPYPEVSKIFLGLEQSIGTRSISFGWQYQDEDNSIISTNRYGQKFIDVINRQKKFNFQFENLSKTEVDDFFSLYDHVGKTLPFFVRIGCDGMINNKNRFAGMVFFEAIPVITNSFYGRYSMECQLSEAM